MSPHELLGRLLQPAFALGGTPTTWAELLGFATGVVTVWLVVRQNIWNWPIGIANVVLLGMIFLDGGLYADAGLQVVYVALQLWGWWSWLHGGQGRAHLVPRRTSRAEWRRLSLAGIAVTGLLTWALTVRTDSDVSFWDAVTTTLSLMATYGQSRKLLESWWLWIAADLVYIPLYAYKGLYLTSGLYVLFLALCVAGLVTWRRDVPVRPVVVPVEATG
ncbi:putative nicotinamide mononucleotide transporter [Sphaerisporangium krabiense]|uniref:Nicotinamide mononucleotide transporter n=1 Tax=Sphaerisporangium krabiense TaxID=763782 RepID=A0A7W8ZAY8_9ACTN|nr:nicotinamide riboside transporter PnuC [Sphaerisporangium krabiense]MBB5630687.1 nicotinamide mononucleotide transporter [Sphaerisporangium krabiense]GII67446.1 putative nicotinamide mononucleotide transporter [Sphaerisporangium krabiense]